MSEIVLGIATSHSPLLALDPSIWAQRGEDDKRRARTLLTDGRGLTYQEMEREFGTPYADQCTETYFTEQYRIAQAALDRLAEELERARPDVLVIVGDDQEELFDKSHLPALAIYSGEEIVMHPRGEVLTDMPEWRRLSTAGYMMDTVHRHPAAPALANHLVEALIADGVDLSIATKVVDPYKAGFGHAFGFIIRRLCRERQIPIVPVMLNTYYRPNVPTPTRCHDIGAKLAMAVRSWRGAKRVAVIASGGMTHFICDEPFDRAVLQAIQEKDVAALKALPVHALRSGTSELLNWIMVAGAMDHLPVSYCEYVPVRRTPVGTGIGLGFLAWASEPTTSDI